MVMFDLSIVRKAIPPTVVSVRPSGALWDRDCRRYAADSIVEA